LSRTIILAALLIATLSVTSCGGSGAQEGPGASSGGEQAADFSVTTLDGEGFSLADKRGEVVALYFMAAY
jgi:cytochrome oxidase Cu insertion factor (SCO1/SenC/PrrC family)